ncbi:MAG: MarR family transcriptional regulator [Burkholderiales bacterium PBB4]|nr:MAG: MarR family transcriptional regulator [Burkholderiales bacterium PBB4]
MDYEVMPGHLIRRLFQLSSQVFANHADSAGYDITPVQFASLLALRDNPGVELARLAELVACDRPTIGGVIERLVAKGLVSRQIASRDRRSREVFLTAEGQATRGALLPVVQEVQRTILRPLSEVDQAAFLTMAAAIVGAGRPTSA